MKQYKTLSTYLVKTSIVNLLSEYELSISTAYYLIKDILNELENQYNEQVEKEYQQSLEDEQKKEKEKETNE
jgi:hypothetical protein